MYRRSPNSDLLSLLHNRPFAQATVDGSEKYPQIVGTVRFIIAPLGILVCAKINGLPVSAEACDDDVFGFHIHEGASCSGNTADPFADAGQHYNPEDCPHPYHAGDLPPLFGADGNAFSIFLTNRFSADDIIGKTIIIHSRPDDFSTQPSGNSGEKIACGVIRAL